MSFELLSTEDVGSLQPDAVQAYLRSRGWEDDGAEGPGARAYVKRGDARTAEVLVPTRANAPDYRQVTALLVERIARYEGLTRESVLRDLAMAGFDVFRVRVVDAEDGALELEKSITVFQQSRAALVAAANAVAAKAPRRNYAGRQPESVGAFVDRVKLGQTERGSFIVPLLSPYAFDIGTAISLPGEWFGRRVMRKLTSGLHAVDDALAAGGASAQESFVAASDRGVSANLCLALGRLIEAAGAIELSVRWASAEPEKFQNSPVRLSEASAPALLRAAAHLAETDPPPPEPIVGFVTKLLEDQAVVETSLEGKWLHVRVPIQSHYRETFANAWRDRTRVMLEGNLKREGRTFTLERVDYASALSGEDED